MSYIEKVIDKDEITLKEIFFHVRTVSKYVVHKSVYILIFGFLGALIGYSYSYLKKPQYIATTTFVLEGGDSPGGNFGQYSGLASMAGIDFGRSSGSIFQGDNIIELYKSRKMLTKTLFSRLQEDSTQLLVDRYISLKGWKSKWFKIQKNGSSGSIINISNSSAFARSQDSLVSLIIDDIKKNNLTVSKLDKKLNIIKVDVKSADEIFSKNFNDQLVKNVNDFYVQTKTKKSLKNVAILQHQTDSVRQILNGAMNNIINIADATPNLNAVRQILRAPAQRSQMNADVNKAILSELVKNLELSKMNLREETPLIQVIDIPVYPLNKEILTKTIGCLLGFIIGAGISTLYFITRFFFKNISLNG